MRNLCALFIMTLVALIPAAAMGITVTTLADENDGPAVGAGTSLREAIDAAVDGETIDFDATLFLGGPGTMTLSQPLGDLIVDKSIAITGPGAATLTLSGGGARRLFQVITDVDFAITGMTIANGMGNGGNGAPGAGGGGGGLGAGGAIYIFDGDVTATDVVFQGNTALGGVGGNSDGVLTTGGGGGGVGDGIDANGSAGTNLNGGAGGPAATGPGGAGGISPFPNEGLDGGPGGGGGGGANSDFGFGSGGDGGFGGGGGGTGHSGASQTSVQPAGNGGFGGGGGGAGRRILDFPVPAATSGGFGGTGGTATNTTASTDTGSGGGGGAGLGGAVFVNDSASFIATGCDFTNNTATGGAPGTSVGDATLATAGQGKGGAIFVRTGGTATLTDPAFDANNAVDAGATSQDNDNLHGAVALAFTGVVVDDAGDDADAVPGDGAISTTGGAITLRAALEELRALGIDGTISFDPALHSSGPYQIDVLASDLIIETEITITGPGADLLTLSGENTRRLFQVIAGGLDIAGVTLANGYGKGGDGGDGSGGGGGGLGAGGAIYVHSGEVIATDVIFLENHAQGGDGGDGLFDLTAGGGGGGIGNGLDANGQTPLGDAGGNGGPSLLSPGGAGGVAPFPNPGNPGGQGAGGGGGANSQFGFGSGGAGGFGGGGGGSGDAGSNTTASSNGGTGGFGGGGGGAGWHNLDFPGAGGAGGTFAGSGGATPGTQSDNGGGGGGAGLGGAVFVDESATFTATGCTFSGNSATGGLPGANRGGGALPGAGAGKGGAIFVRAGGTVTLSNPLFDGNDAADAGATQDDNDSIHGTVTSTINIPFIVDTLDDTTDATPGDLAAEDSNGNTSLRAALQETAALNIAAEIQFDPALFSGGPDVISLGLGALIVSNGAKTITGPGADLLTIHGADASRIFEATDALTLKGVRLTRGLGGIEAFAPVTVEDVVFEDCHAGLANGGAIMAVNALVMARRSTFAGCTGNNGGGIALLGVSSAGLHAWECVFTGNASEVSGGAIFVDSAELALVNCTLSDNETAGPGSAIQAGLKAGSAMAHCTITGNRADSDGDDAGISSAVSISGEAPLYNSIVAGNFSGPQASPFEFVQPDVSATAIPDGGTNIIGNPAGITNGLDASSRDFAALGISDLSELLSPLAENGGATLSHALPLGSPAINTGDDDRAVDPTSSLPLTTDQRGTGFPRIEGSAVDIGAFERTADSVAPTVTINQAAGQEDPVNSLPILFEIVFSEPVVTFDDASIATAGVSGPVLALTRTGLATFELAVNALGQDGDLTVSILAGAAEDTFGNLSIASTSSDNRVTYDTTSPTIQWTGPGVDPVGGSPILFTATFDEPVYGLTSADLVVTNGVGSIVAGADGDAVYEIEVAPTGDGQLTLTMPAGVCEDAAGNANVGPVQISRTYDSTGPVPVVTSTSPALTNAAPIAITVTFDEPVVDVIAGGLALTNASAVRTGGDPGGTEFTYDLAPLSEGPFSVSVLPGAATDPVGNSSAASNTLNFTYDITAPQPLIETTATSPTAVEPIPFTVVFNEAVTGFEAGDITVTNGTVANFTGAGTSYAFGVFPGNDGIVDVDLPAGVAQDAAGNPNVAASLAADLVYDTVAPSVLSVTRTGGSLTNAATVDFAVEFSEAVTGVDGADFTVDVTTGITGASVASVTGVGAAYVVSVNTGSGEGLLSIDVAANGTVIDAADRPLAQAFTSGEAYQVDRVAPTATLFSGAPDPVTTAIIPVTVTFSESVSGLDLAAIAVTNGTPQDLAGSGAAYSFTVVAAASGIVSISVNNGAAQDAAGNASTPSTALTREFIDLGVCDTPFHTVDQNHDNKIALSELLRAIQFYNSETYHCESGTEDGYAPGLGDIGTCCPHDSDYGLQNWSISLSELLRAIQFYNTGEYHYCPSSSTEDGYCPGAAP